MKRFLTGVIFAASATALDECVDSTPEINENAGLVGGMLISNHHELFFEIMDNHRVFYQADTITVCPSADGQKIEGFQFELGAHKRADWANYVKEYIPSHFLDIQLRILGKHNADCEKFEIDSEDYFKEVTIWHSPEAIHAFKFETNQGKLFNVGSNLDVSNGNLWEDTSVQIGENERLLGAYGHVWRQGSEFSLRTIGFLKNECWAIGSTETLPKKETHHAPAHYFEELREEDYKEMEMEEKNSNSKLSQLPLTTTHFNSKAFDSYSASPGQESDSWAMVSLVLACLCSTISCCFCLYCFLKNRKSVMGMQKKKADEV